MSADESRRSPSHRAARPVEKKVLPPGPAKDLRDDVYVLYVESDRVQLAELARRIADADLPGSPGKDLIGKIISGEALASQLDTVTVATILARGAKGRDEAQEAEKIRQKWIAAATAEPAETSDDRLGTPIGDCDPLALEVHRAIQVPGDVEVDVLPSYVPRAHDARMREIVDGMLADGRSRLVTLVGASSTGKTRAGWELARYLEGRQPGRWRLWHPFDPTRPEAALADLAKAGPETIVWLNEAQHYLLTPADPGLGERIAAGLRGLLTVPSRGPVLVLATLWTNYWTTLTTGPASGGPDAFGQARNLLDLGTTVTLGDTFTSAELEGLTGAGIDARVRYAAARAEGGRITQYLAGAPVLEDRYRTAVKSMPAARAVLHAAIDARRLGHSLALPHALLKQAAHGYLDDHDWDALDDCWFEAALAYTSQPCKGARGPLTRIRPRPGEPGTGGQPCYRLADYLEQLGHAERGGIYPPDSLWQAFASASADPGALLVLGKNAEDRGRFRHAAALLAEGAGGGDRESAARLARLLHRGGRGDEAYPWWRFAAEAGDAAAMVTLAARLESLGDTEEAIRWWTAAADAGNQEAPCRMAYHLHGAGREDDARDWWRRAVAASGGEDYWANRAIMDFLLREGRSDEAMAWAPRRMSYSGGMTRWPELARLLHRQGRTEESITYWKKYIENKDEDDGDFVEVLRQATTTMLEAGRAEDMIAWLRAAAERNHEHEKHEFVQRLTEFGRVDEAVKWLTDYMTKRPAANDRTALWIADLLQADGRPDDALASLQRAAAAGNAGALAQAIAMMQASGRSQQAFDWLASSGPQSPASAVQTRVLCLMVRALRTAGHRSLALLLLQEAAEAFGFFWHFMRDADIAPAQALQMWDDAYSRLSAGDLAYATFVVDDAGAYLDLLQRLAVQGAKAADQNRLGAGAAALRGEDDARQVAAWLDTRSSGNDPDSRRPVLAAGLAARSGFEAEALAAYQRLGELYRQIELLEAMGRVDEAVQLLLETSGVSSDNYFVRRSIAELIRRTRGIDEAAAFMRDYHPGLARLYSEAGYHQEAIVAWRASADRGSPDALDQIAAVLRREGDSHGARQLQRYGWEADGTDALPWTAPCPPVTTDLQEYSDVSGIERS